MSGALRGLLAMAAIALLGLLLYRATLAQAGVVCEACVIHQGRRACGSASAADRPEAERAAVATACAIVAPGVTATLACQRTPPASLECRTP